MLNISPLSAGGRYARLLIFSCLITPSRRLKTGLCYLVEPFLADADTVSPKLKHRIRGHRRKIILGRDDDLFLCTPMLIRDKGSDNKQIDGKMQQSVTGKGSAERVCTSFNNMEADGYAQA